MQSLVEQIKREQEAQGWSTQQLLEKSGLKIERSVLHRKLDGQTPASTRECEALAAALDLTLVWPNRLKPVKKTKKNRAKRAAA